MLTFLVTHTIYLPVALVSVAFLPQFEPDVVELGGGFAVRVRWFTFFDAIAERITALLGPTVAFLVAFVLLLVTMRLFDRVLAPSSAPS